jgi:DNA-directed RNA polymerase subunit RPC12/RpoP
MALFKCSKCQNTITVDKRSDELYFYYHTHLGKECLGGKFERMCGHEFDNKEQNSANGYIRCKLCHLLVFTGDEDE